MHGTLAQQADARARALGVTALGGTEAPACPAPQAAEDDDEGDDEQPAAVRTAPSGG